MPPKKKDKCLADKINNLITAVPVNFESDDDSEETTKAKVVEHFEEDEASDKDVGQSKIRRQNVHLLNQIDKRYEGKKVSRKDVETESGDSDASSIETIDTMVEEDHESISEDDATPSDSDNATSSNEEDPESEEEEEVSSEESNSDNEDDSCVDEENPLYRKRNISDFKTMSSTNVRNDVEKGHCVRNQLKIWERLLEARIKLQKCLVANNQMPQYDTYPDFKSHNEFMKRANETKSNLTKLLDNMLLLQDTLLKKYPETKNILKTKNQGDENTNQEDQEMDEEIPSDTEDEIEQGDAINSESEVEEQGNESPKKKRKFSDYEKLLDDRHKCYRNYRDSVIQKWNEKTRVASGHLTKGSTLTVSKQIEFALNDMNKLRRKTQLKRSDYPILGKTPTTEDETDGKRVQEYDTEIFDDDDFYHQLLRDLIEFKSSDITDPVQLSKQWIELQNMRRKMKKKVDTRATKGRKIRYNVHNKLVNFMAPITVYDTWTDIAKNELYNSLFGKFDSTDNGCAK